MNDRRKPVERVPDAVSPAALPELLAALMRGTPAAGTPTESVQESAHREVIWVDHGDELLVHLDSIRTLYGDKTVLVSVDVETDQTGRETVVVPFALGSEPGGKPVVVFEALPRGPELLVRRWGPVLQEALYAAVLELVVAHATERNALPTTPYIRDKALRFGKGAAP